LINGLVTLYFAPSLYRIYRNRQRRFYLYWGLGYLFYGINIIIRLFTPEGIEISLGGMIAFFFVMLGFAFMVVGVGELIDKPS
jgi:dolichol kinase